MAADRFFYSIDGSEMEGPVDEATLRQLCLDHVLGPGSYFCRESESEWRPLDPASFLATPPSVMAAERKADPIGLLFKVIAGLTLVLVFILAVLGWIYYGNNPAPVVTTPVADNAPESFAGMAERPEDIERFLRAEKVLSQIKVDSQDSSLQGRFLRALFTVSGELMAKVSACLKKEDESRFAVQPAHGAADLAAQISKLRDLRDDQTDLVVYLQDFDQHFRDLLSGQSVPLIAQPQFVDYTHNKAGIDTHLAYWRSKLDLTNQAINRLDFLQKNQGHWELKGGKITFTDDKLGAIHDQMLNAIYADETKIVKSEEDSL